MDGQGIGRGIPERLSDNHTRFQIELSGVAGANYHLAFELALRQGTLPVRTTIIDCVESSPSIEYQNPQPLKPDSLALPRLNLRCPGDLDKLSHLSLLGWGCTPQAKGPRRYSAIYSFKTQMA